MTLLFVYGSLRRDAAGSVHPLLGPDARWQGNARYQGCLYRVADYPGAVPSQERSDTVHGELYALPEPDAVWPALDAWENCAPHAEPAEYRRAQVEVCLTDGSRGTAWIYLYARPIEALARIDSGCFAP